MAVHADEVVLTTCPRDCYDACGIAVVKRNGTIRHVRGDPDHPVSRGKLCRKCSIGYNGAFRDPKARLTRPLRRAGAKGEGRFEQVSWDEALVENETGSLRLRVTVSDVVPHGVAYSPKGRWPKQELDRANVNALNPGESADMGRSTSVHGVEVTVAAG